MNRRNPAFQHIDLDVWPSVDSGALSPDKAAFFKRRRQAIDAYVSGASLRNIEEETGINSRQLYRTLNRCLLPAEDGRMYGYRALIKYDRVVTYSRQERISETHLQLKTGLAGAFTLLMES